MNAGAIGSSEGPRFQLRVLARAGSSTLNVSGRVSWDRSLLFAEAPSLGGGTGAIAELRAAGAEQPALVARLIPMAARCAAPPGPTAGSQPVGAGSLEPMAQSLATEVWSAGRSSGSALCNLPRAVRRSVAEACWIREVAQSTNYGRDAFYKQAVAGRAPPCTNPACSHAAIRRLAGAAKCAAQLIIDGWAAKTTVLDCEGDIRISRLL